MVRWCALVASAALASGCFYVTRAEFLQEADFDGDGWEKELDCNDTNPLVHPYAADVRGDGCDANCGTENDVDGDDWPDEADCKPAEADVFPCNPAESSSSPEDLDCDGTKGKRDLDLHPCNDADAAYGIDPSYGLDPDFQPSPTATSQERQRPIPADECGEAFIR